MKSSDIMKAKVSAKGWIVIPAALRKRFCLKPGDMVEFQAKDDRITLIPEIVDPVEASVWKTGRENIPDGSVA